MPRVGSVLALLGAAPVTGVVTAHALYGPCGVAVGVYAGAGASLLPLAAAAVIGYRASVDDPAPPVLDPDDAGPALAPTDDIDPNDDGPDGGGRGGADVVPLGSRRVTGAVAARVAGLAPTGTEVRR